MLVKLAVDVLEQEHYNNRRHLQQQITTEGKGTGNVNLYSAFKSNWPVSQSHFLAKLYYTATAIACKCVCVCVCLCFRVRLAQLTL